ncbi:hypothetical protein HMH01_11260 [Halovulum dunhuangense]|uniref:Secreted protein n=1 Tax=Halovulum dunhuangense TaxID=1505036 RepID=A0A849L3V6_9RHOB|nr:hypothetical protein [Halovulum dunhuangense]NNU81015.1 hypothetical protein [Halovulum dunhuangense]
MRSAALALFLALAAPLSAQDDPSLAPIPPEEWRSMVEGRTVTYLIGEEVWARETYDRSGNGVSIRLADGTCMDGVWDFTDGAYCFTWSGGEYSCFLHLRDGAEILIVPILDGATGAVQTVGGITDSGPGCGPDLIG